jgi:hypothetical protein
MFGGGNGPASTSTKAAFREIEANRAKLCWRTSISAGVICLFIFFSSSRYTITLRDYQLPSMADAVGQQYCPRQLVAVSPTVGSNNQVVITIPTAIIAMPMRM